MKKYKNIFFLNVFFFVLLSVMGCKEDDTLDGAEEVYIEISPKDGYIMLGDTVSLRAIVSNVSGDVIDTPVKWSVDDDRVLKLENGNVTAVEGAQGKSTNVRATLQNGKYAISKMTVTNHIVDGVGALVDTYYSYNNDFDTIWFVVNPKNLLLDYEPTVENSNKQLVVPKANSLKVNKETGMVGYAFSSAREAGSVTITLSIGPSGNEEKASTEIVLCPVVEASFSSDFSYPTYEYYTTMDINAEDTVWLYTRITPAQNADLENALQYYKWSATGNASQMVKSDVEIVEYRGYDAYIVLRSAAFEGTSQFKFSCYGSEATATIDVQDYKLRYPVEKLYTDKESYSVPMEATILVIPSVEPLSSYAYHQPRFTIEDETLAELLGYDGGAMRVRGLKEGSTNLIITSNDKTIKVPLEITEKVNQIIWESGNPLTMFVGTSVEWKATVKTVSGRIYPVNWISLNEDIAVATPHEDDSSMATITAFSAGRASFRAEAGGKVTTDSPIRVLPIPEEDIVLTDENTIGDGNAVYEDYLNDESVLSVILTPKDSEYGVFRIYIHGFVSGSDPTGTYDAATSAMTLDIDGAKAEIVSGTISVAYDNNGASIINANVTVKVNDKKFTLKASIGS
jgi:lipoprotein